MESFLYGATILAAFILGLILVALVPLVFKSIVTATGTGPRSLPRIPGWVIVIAILAGLGYYFKLPNFTGFSALIIVHLAAFLYAAWYGFKKYESKAVQLFTLLLGGYLLVGTVALVFLGPTRAFALYKRIGDTGYAWMMDQHSSSPPAGTAGTREANAIPEPLIMIVSETEWQTVDLPMGPCVSWRGNGPYETEVLTTADNNFHSMSEWNELKKKGYKLYQLRHRVLSQHRVKVVHTFGAPGTCS